MRAMPVAPTDDAPILECRDIQFSHGRLQVLFGIDLRVAPGEALAPLGTNGADMRERRARVLELFPRLSERLRQTAGSLSGGEQQQLALANALGIVRQINARGVAVVLVEKSLNIAAARYTRAVFLEKGSVRFEGSPDDPLERDDVARAVFLGAAKETDR